MLHFASKFVCVCVYIFCGTFLHRREPTHYVPVCPCDSNLTLMPASCVFHIHSPCSTYKQLPFLQIFSNDHQKKHSQVHYTKAGTSEFSLQYFDIFSQLGNTKGATFFKRQKTWTSSGVLARLHKAVRNLGPTEQNNQQPFCKRHSGNRHFALLDTDF